MSALGRHDDVFAYAGQAEVIGNPVVPVIDRMSDVLTAKTVGYRPPNSSGLELAWSGDCPSPVSNSIGRDLNLAMKRVMDVALSLSALLALAPLFLLIAFAIKIESRGPVFFVQPREGLNGKIFDIFKFRSMRTEVCDLTGVAQTVKGDPRVTIVGRFLRRTSIDELPQLFNVLFGSMSIVGPRPHVAGMLASGKSYKELVPYYADRFAMKPGITGWAQANGLRGGTEQATKAQARIDHDIAYIQNFSIGLDLKIILMTIAREFVTGHAD
jgi:polysaccharide biosynthesis protein PslA